MAASDRGWFGFATVTKPARKDRAIWHGFKKAIAGAPSLCGRVTYGAGYLHIGGRPCRACEALWRKQYPASAR